MKSTDKTQKQLVAENEDLRARLEEAQETLLAIRNGEWDALVVLGVGGEQILMLKQSELRYRRLFEAAQDGILILNAGTGAITDVNPFLIKMLGYSREEFVEKKLWEVGAFKDIEASQDAFEALQQNEYIRYDDLPLKTKDGRLIPVEFVSNVYQVDKEKVIQCNIREISARKQAEQALQESEKRFRALIENSSDAITLLDAKGIALYDSPAAAGMLGYAAKDWIGHNVFTLVHPDDLPKTQALFQNLIETPGAHLNSTFRVRHKSGAWLWLEMVVTNLLTEPAVKAMVLNYRDVTERKQMDDALRESNERFRQVWETTSDAMALSDSDGIVQAANPKYLDLYGYTSEQVLGKSFAIIFPEDNRIWAVEQYKLIFATEVIPPVFESTIVRADHSARIVETHVTFLNIAGRRTAMLSNIRDITERKLAERALAESERHYRQIIETAGEGIWTIDAANRTMLVNPHLADMLGYTIEEMIGKSVYDFMDEEGKAIAVMSLENRRQGINEQLDFKYKHKDGSTVWALIETSTLLDANGQYMGALAMLTDITKRKLAETEIRQRLSELEVLYQSGLAFSQLIDPKTIAEKIIDLLDQEMDWHHTAVRLYHAESATLELLAFNLPNLNTRAERNAAEEQLKIMKRPNQGLSGWAIQHKQVVRCNDLKNDARYLETFPGLQSGLYVPIRTLGRVLGVISIESERPLAFTESDERLAMTLAGQAALAMENATLFQSLQRSNLELMMAYDATIEGWSRALDLRDRETEGHSLRVTDMTVKLARALGLGEADLAQIRWGALLHDIGKMGVPDGILLKPGALTEDEWVAMKKHPAFAYDMLLPIRYLRRALDIPYCHHEKWDGSGYPRGLKGAQIPLAARIFTVVDVWDALRSDRPYRDGWEDEKVFEHIRFSSGTHFDPQVVDMFMQMNEQSNGGLASPK